MAITKLNTSTDAALTTAFGGIFQPAADNSVNPTLMVSSQGKEKSGKSFWAMSGPGDIAVIASDTGTAPVVQEWVRKGKKIHLYTYRVPKGGSNTIEDYKREWNKVQSAFEMIIDNHKRLGIRTLVVDTGTEVWEMKRLAEFGKLSQVLPHKYVEVNTAYRNLVKSVWDAGDLNSVWIHKVKKEYKTNKEGKDAWTGMWEYAGFGDMPFLCDIPIVHRFDHEDHQFGIEVLDSRYHPEILVGQALWGDMSSFQTLGQLAWPDTDPGYWE